MGLNTFDGFREVVFGVWEVLKLVAEGVAIYSLPQNIFNENANFFHLKLQLFLTLSKPSKMVTTGQRQLYIYKVLHGGRWPPKLADLKVKKRKRVKIKKLAFASLYIEASASEGGLDGTRTRDLLRDRQAF